MWNVVWQLFAMAVALLVLGLLFWDGFLRGHRSRRSLAIGFVAAVVVATAGVVQAS